MCLYSVYVCITMGLLSKDLSKMRTLKWALSLLMYLLNMFKCIDSHEDRSYYTNQALFFSMKK